MDRLLAVKIDLKELYLINLYNCWLAIIILIYKIIVTCTNSANYITCILLTVLLGYII